ncbi:porin B precursor [Variibacter gotjawalensis]|uniref:Porin B n=1 Tax=Variibacter gotjawalensis TaxID=1333996 RepID=A0A0S3Q0T0_9BRAD|nr:carbohydrate porin [Variibacter gotjawalensis]NIK47657.1 porin [Variibacter gotjawalensis]RZS49554.1 OprB family porin [Variibacter gotjawalensis]BAT61817.1 porin B precursor [Variibacter gotjawalensis]
MSTRLETSTKGSFWLNLANDLHLHSQKALGAAVLALALASPAARAEEAPTGIPPVSIATSLPANGDPLNIRAWLAAHGITYGSTYTNEILGNVSGGLRQGGLYAGKLEASVGLDFEKIAGWSGLTFFGNAFQIHNTSGLRDKHFFSFITISNIEAAPSTRLSELWFEQKFFADRASFRFGQLAADAEFFFNDSSKMFISSDWPTILGANLPSGGPAYPLATPGVRFKYEHNANWTGLVALYNGDPGSQFGANRHGINFRVNDPPLLMTEIQHRLNQEKDATGPATTLKLGGWHHFGQFKHMHFDDAGVSLASPVSNGRARLFDGTSGIYGIFDQQIYRPAGGDATSGISVFSRIAATSSDRNIVDLFVDGGIVFAGFVANRPDDRFGASFIYARMSDHARQLDYDRLAGAIGPVRDYELTVELTYLAQIKPGWTVQPLVQYVAHPGGHVPDPNDPTRAVRNGVLFGMRSTVIY